MKVAFYLDIGTQDLVDCAYMAMASVRKWSPDAEVIHLTSPHGPVINNAVRYQVDAQGPFGFKRPNIQSHLEGEVLFLGVDCVMQQNVEKIWNEDFDIAIATDIKPGSPRIKYNADVVFSRCPEFWEDVRDRCKNLNFDDWQGIEGAYTDAVDSGKYRVLILDGMLYNRVPTTPDEDVSHAAIVHYRGGRKAWMLARMQAKYIGGLNNDASVMIEQFKENLKRDLPWFVGSEDKQKPALIVGGGPSLNESQHDLRYRIHKGGVVFALNGAHDWLLERGIKPHYQVLLDSRQGNTTFVQNPRKSVKYLVSAFCHPSVFDALEGYDVTLWMSDMDDIIELVQDIEDKPVCLIGGGATVGLKTMFLAYVMGHRSLHFYGLDSCYREDANHAYPQPMNDAESRQDIYAGGRMFKCAPWMAKQAQEFQGQARKLLDLGCTINVHGDGLIAWILKQWSKAA